MPAPARRPGRLRATDRDLVVAVSPFEEPNPRIVTAAERAGALGLLDLGRDAGAARRAMAEVARRLGAGRYGVRVPAGCPIGPGELAPEVDTVLLCDPATHTPDGVAGWAAAAGRPRVWAEITDPVRAEAAVVAGVEALVAKGHEAGGRVGGTTTFVLLQQLLSEPASAVPVRAYGGIGPHTAAAAVAGGAAGVVVDVQLALTPEGEAGLPTEVASAVRAMDGSETRVVRGHRVYARPDLTPPSGPVAGLLGARDLRTQLLPVGQDGASAARLAARYRTTGGILHGIRSAVVGHLTAVVRARPLGGGHGPGRPLPVAQGPMTRVSDQAAFAEAVAAAGGIPYLALAVMEGPQVRRLLAETAERLGDRPWGVGLLGFAPAELRAEQLEAVAEVRPPHAIIAGGTPGQAAPLEAAGTRTHLHVPSPGLLERYLAEGARRFVFEGLECGGHVGPRASFPLWEEQIELLLSCPEPGALDVLFAGGVHDARSAAMAAAAAAPLAERGARIGVLMGTAYLFTEEAVAAGAVLPRFQRAALECADTVLLHTAPGHATRCAVTPYVDTFEATRVRLAEGGAEPRQVWEELERLNLGRLRIASKGLRRGPDGSGLEHVGEEQQDAEGLFMIGQAATLRSGTTTIAALHTEVTDGATELLRQRAQELTGPESEGETAAEAPADRPEPLDVAVVGMACAYPGAPDLAAYWARILSGTDAVTEVPAERWDPAIHFDPDPARAGERTPSRWGGFLGPVPFDALAHGIPPASLAGIEPVQLLALEISARALADAGYGKDREFDRSRTSVVFGAEAGTELAGAYGLRALYPGYLGELPPELDEQLPRLTEDSFPGVLANVIAGRVANRLDLGGANCTVDAACASSLAALDLACRQLRDRDSDMVLCGGADVHNGINDYLLFSSVRALSPGGRCRPFDAAADGIALGEGVGALVLKRLADAERDGDRVYAVIKAVGSASDGRSLGLTAPRPEGQRRALDRAYARAGISPGEVGLIEAHGTGTVVGDTTELAVLNALFTESGAAAGACALGSVKSQIGHTKCAAGLAGLIKAVRAVHSGVRPPTLHLDAPVPSWSAETSPFFFDTQARPWAAPAQRRIAGVSAFGFGGTNYHAVLTGYAGAEEPRHGREEWPAELFCFRGQDRRAAGRAMARLAARLEENDAAGRPWALRDLAAEAAADSGPVRVAVVAADLDELAARLENARAFTAGAGVHLRGESVEPGQVAFLFPGQGSQRPGMMGELFTSFPRLRELLDTAPNAVVSAMFPPAAFTAQGRTAQRAAVTDTRVAQPALGLAGSAAHLLLGELGVRPDCVAGHSYGELTALWAAEVWDHGSLLRLSAHRAEAIVAAAGADPGSMAAVAAPPEEVREIAARAGCVVANHNAPRQCVISGPADAVAEAVTALREAGLSVDPLPVACAFHSAVVAGAGAALAEELAGTELSDAAVPVWSNTTAAPYPVTAGEVRDLVARQVAEPVRFVEQVEHMYAAGVRTFVEAGPGRVLSGLVGRILHDRPHTVVPLDVPGEHGLLRLVTALAELAAAGVPVDPDALFRGRSTRLPERAPRRPGWLVDGHLVRTSDGNPVPGGLRPARRVHIAVPERKGAQQMAQPTNGSGPGGDFDPPAAHVKGGPAMSGSTADAAVGGDRLPVGGPDEGGSAGGFDRVGGTAVGQAVAHFGTGRAGVPAAEGEPALLGSAESMAGPAAGGAVGRPVQAANGFAGGGLEPSGDPAADRAGGYFEPAVERAGAAAADHRTEAVLEYLRGSRELVQAQREVLLGYLGSPVTAWPWPGSAPARHPAVTAPATLPALGAGSGRTDPQGVAVARGRGAGQGAAGPQGPGSAPELLQGAAPSVLRAELRPDGRSLPAGAAGSWSADYVEAPGVFTDTASAPFRPVGVVPAGSADPSWSAARGEDGDSGPGGAALAGGAPVSGLAGGEVRGEGPPGGGGRGSGMPGGADQGEGMPGGGARAGGLPGCDGHVGGMPGGARADGMPGGVGHGNGMPGGVVHEDGLTRGGVGGGGSVGEVRGGSRSAEEVMDVIVEIVHTRTGYPRDMLAPDLDLEADLSIDSIKRVEIIGALADRIGLPQDPGGSAESAIEELSRIKTLRGIVDWVWGHTARPGPPAPAEATTAFTATTTTGTAAAAAPPALARLRVDLHALPPAPGDPEVVRGLRIGIVGDGHGVGTAITGALRTHGADVRMLGEAEAGFDAVLDLSALSPGAAPVLPDVFPGLRRALTGGVRRLLLVTARADSAGAGMHGFARSASLEYPGRLVRAVEVHPKEDPERIAAQLLAELSCEPAAPTGSSVSVEDPAAHASVGYTAEGLRVTRRPVPARLVPGDGPPPLDAGSVVLLTGGARGITARIALALARATGCHVELMGRTPQPSAEGDEFGNAADRVALRAALIATGLRTPAEIEAAASRILAEREVRATLASLATVAASVGYHCADVTDEQAVRAVVAAVRARHGRLDGIVHGAGTLRDGLLRDKQPAAFAEVFTTKVTGARHLAAAAAEHGTAPAPRFLALFGSVAGVYGNRGQSDYAAANDALDGLAHIWAENFPGRVLSVDWGPWAAEAGGMVGPELARAYARRGIALIDPDAGSAAFLAELAHGTDVQVVLMAAGGHEGTERRD
ncbi:SDR family NAD(P)-dependent oxidoreductase [Streptomyces sp. H27-H1]|uniref:type I polyketide synthase n=1 Tax=Streptomyces sp. H27-H1 TaxID=2996461 RepID=UPI002270BA1F|nr:type I polyketide synthase [Streptomyces sp. H27-H1]MCY0925397.1 SDR family NAD(P)-dependent oxidoreductase [Streptomyces sp. H27-H1]